MNNKFSPIDLRAERKQCHESIITGAHGIKGSVFWKLGEQMKSQWIPCNHQQKFGLELYVLAFRVVVLLRNARYAQDLSKGKAMTHPEG
jgi:hypothetical protein